MTRMSTNLSKMFRDSISVAAAEVKAKLPETVQSALGDHDVWYRVDEDGLYACIETTGLAPFQVVVDDDERSQWSLIGWRVDLPKSDLARLRELGRDVAD